MVDCINILDMEERFFGVTLNGFRKLADDFAAKKLHLAPI